MTKRWLKVGQVWSASIAAVGVMKLSEWEPVVDEWNTFGYPREMMKPIGVLDICCGIGCLARTTWGGPLLLFLTGGGTSVTIRRALLPECPQIDRFCEIGTAVAENGASCIAAASCCSVSHSSLIVYISCGIFAAWSLHILLETSPTHRLDWIDNST